MISRRLFLLFSLLFCIGFAGFSPFRAYAQISSGNFLSGSIFQLNRESVLGITVTLTNTATQETKTTTTDQQGNYSFSNLALGTYRLSPKKQDASTTNISAVDAVFVLQGVVGIKTFTPEQRIIADVSGDGILSAVDAVMILQKKVELISRFVIGERCNSDWLFVPSASNATLTQPNVTASSCQNGEATISIISSAPTTQNFTALQFGDVSGSVAGAALTGSGGGGAASVETGRFSFSGSWPGWWINNVSGGVYDSSGEGGSRIDYDFDLPFWETFSSWFPKRGLQINVFPFQRGTPQCINRTGSLAAYDPRIVLSHYFPLRARLDLNDPKSFIPAAGVVYDVSGATLHVSPRIGNDLQPSTSYRPSSRVVGEPFPEGIVQIGNAGYHAVIDAVERKGSTGGSYPWNGARLCACANYLNVSSYAPSDAFCWDSVSIAKPNSPQNLRVTYDADSGAFHVHWDLSEDHRTLRQEFRMVDIEQNKVIYSRTFSYYDDPRRKSFDFDISPRDLGSALSDPQTSIQAFVNARNPNGSTNSDRIVVALGNPVVAPQLTNVQLRESGKELNNAYVFSWRIDGAPGRTLPSSFLLEIAKDDNSFARDNVLYQGKFAFDVPGEYTGFVHVADMNLPLGEYTFFARISSIVGDDVNNPLEKAPSNVLALPTIPFRCERPALGTGTTQTGEVFNNVPTCYDSRSDQYGLANIVSDNGFIIPISTRLKINGELKHFLSKDNIWGGPRVDTQSSPADLSSFAFEAHRNLNLVQQALQKNFGIFNNHPPTIRQDIEQNNPGCWVNSPINLRIAGDTEDVTDGPYTDSFGIQLPYIVDLKRLVDLKRPFQWRPDVNTIGHEYGHGLYGCYVQDTYGRGDHENDALNESFADLVGMFAEAQINGIINFTSNFKLLGSEIEEFIIRNFANPEQILIASIEPHPSTYTSRSYLLNDPHVNAGIPNKAFYLMINGGTHNGITTAPMSNTIQDSIVNVANTAILAAQNYWTKDTVIRNGNAGYGMFSAARNLFGRDSKEVKTVADAWTAVLKYPECQSVDDIKTTTKINLRSDQRSYYEFSGHLTFTPPPGFNFDYFAKNFRLALPTVTVGDAGNIIIFDTTKGSFNFVKNNSGSYAISQSSRLSNVNLTISQDTSYKQVRVSYKKKQISNFSGTLFPTFGLPIVQEVTALLSSPALGSTGSSCNFVPADRCTLSADNKQVNCQVKTRIPSRAPSQMRSLVVGSVSDDPDFGQEPATPSDPGP